MFRVRLGFPNSFTQEKIALLFGYKGGTYQGTGSEYDVELEVSSDTASTIYGSATVEGKILAALDVARGVGQRDGAHLKLSAPRL